MPAADEANLELNLGFDSLDRILLLASVEASFGTAIPENAAARIFTVGDLIEAVRSRAHDSADCSARTWPEILNRPLDETEQSLADSILKQRPVMTGLAWSGAQALRMLWRRRIRFAVSGTERLPTQGAWLLAANHCSHLDPLFLAWALPYRIAKQLSFMGHTEYFGSGWKSAVAKRLKLVPVDPDQHALRGMGLCAEALRRGFIGAVFPEGERSPNGAQQRFHRGTAVLARELRVPIVPAAICGSYEVFPRGRDRIVPGPVQVHFGDVLRAEADETEEELLSRLWAAVAQLRGPDAQPREPMPLPMDLAPHPQ
jgi:long-chain acyl-CoA synthetase